MKKVETRARLNPLEADVDSRLTYTSTGLIVVVAAALCGVIGFLIARRK